MNKRLALLLLIPLVCSCGGPSSPSAMESESVSLVSSSDSPIISVSHASSEESLVLPSSSNEASSTESEESSIDLPTSKGESESSSKGGNESSKGTTSSEEESSPEAESSSEESSFEPSSEEPSSEPFSEEPSSEPFSEEPSSEELPSEESSETQSEEEEEIHTLVLDSSNGALPSSVSYGDTSSPYIHKEAKLDDRSLFEVGFLNCMYSTKSGYSYAQMHKSDGEIYSITSLGTIKSILVTFSTVGKLKMSVSHLGDEEVLISNDIGNGDTYFLKDGYSHFHLYAGGNAVNIGKIEITYAMKESLPTEPPIDMSQSKSSYEENNSPYSYVPSSSSLYSVDPETYYSGISDSLEGASLKTSLWNLIKNHTNKGYDFAYEAYKSSDVDENGKIIDIYSSCHYDPVSDRQGASGKSSYSKEGDLYNREHMIPQSLFNEAAPMKADLHHLFPTDGYVNNRRGNYPHAEVGTSTDYVSSNGTKIGYCVTSGYSGKACEVIDEYKGDVARVYFYMVTRYEDVITKWGAYACFDKTSFPALSSWAKELYLKWNEEDPVSDRERARNDAISAYQRNRNPFVDHPEYASRIWG